MNKEIDWDARIDELQRSLVSDFEFLDKIRNRESMASLVSTIERGITRRTRILGDMIERHGRNPNGNRARDI